MEFLRLERPRKSEILVHPQPQQSEERHCDQQRVISGRVLRPQGPARQGNQLGADVAREGLEYHSATLWPAGAVVQQDLATERDRGSEVSLSRSRSTTVRC